MLLQDIANIISQQAGWKDATPNQDNIITFDLQDGLTLNIHSPDGKTNILFSMIRQLPSDSFHANEIIEKTSKYAVGTCKTRKSTISIHNNYIMLHQDITSMEHAYEINAVAKDFLNDVTWWKKQLV